MEYQNEFELAGLISRSQLGLLTPEEEHDLKDRITASEQHQELYDKILAGTSFQAREKLEEQINLDKVCGKIEGKINSSAFHRWIWRTASVAAILAGGIIVASIYLWPGKSDELQQFKTILAINPGSTKAILTLYNGEQKVLTGEENMEDLQQITADSRLTDQRSEDACNKIEIPRGGEYQLTLSDGTRVWLNAESVFEYPLNFNAKHRTVKLSGEAYFEVAHKAACPFKVLTNNNIQVEVLGTMFNVHSYNDRSDIQITLVEGMVAVEHDKEVAYLHPNQQAVFDRAQNRLSVREVPDAWSYCSWKNGMFIFEGEPLNIIMEALAKWYDVQIVYDGINPATLGHFSINIDRCESFIPILAMLKQITGLDYRIESKKVYLSIPR